MGNKESNDDFSKNANFNMREHQQAMAHLQSNYTNTDYKFQGGGHASRNIQVKET